MAVAAPAAAGSLWPAALVAAGGSVLGGLFNQSGANRQAAAARYAARLQYQAAMENLAFQREQWTTARADYAPWLQAGVSALPNLQEMAGQPVVGQFDVTQTPGYQFRLDQGLQGVENSFAARGLSSSGAAQKALLRYGQDYASGEYGNEWTRRFQEGQAGWNRYAGLAGIGQDATAAVTGAGQNFANQAGQSVMGGANALAQGTIGAANANASAYQGWGNALQGATSSIADMMTMNYLLTNYPDLFRRGS